MRRGPVADDEDAAVGGRSLDLCDLAVAERARQPGQQLAGGARERGGVLPSASVDPATSPSSSKSTAASICEEISVRSASAWAASIGRRR